MKKIFIGALLVLTTTFARSQTPGRSALLVKTDYLTKSKNQNTTAWILVSGGAVLMLTGALIPPGEYTSSGNVWEDLWGGGHYQNDGIRAAFGTAGFLSMLGSIPFFVGSRSNKRKAAGLSIKTESAPQIHNGSFVNHRVPSLTFKVSL